MVGRASVPARNTACGHGGPPTRQVFRNPELRGSTPKKSYLPKTHLRLGAKKSYLPHASNRQGAKKSYLPRASNRLTRVPKLRGLR